MPKHITTWLAGAALVAILLSTGCKPENTDIKEGVQLSYYYTYNADADSTYIRYSATGYGSNGSSLYWLTDSVFFNGHRLAGASVYDVLALPGFVSSGTFTYYSAAGDTFTHLISGLQLYTLPAGFTTLYKHITDTLYWQGPAYDGTQHIKLTLEQGQQVNESVFNAGRPYIVLDSAWKKQHLVAGTNNTVAVLEYIGSSTSDVGAPRGSWVDIRVQGPGKIVSVY